MKPFPRHTVRARARPPAIPPATLARPLLLSLSLGLLLAPAPADAGASAKARAAAQEPCACDAGWRTYATTPTPAVKALWAAAREGDEAGFRAGLEAVARFNDYAVDGQPLLHALLTPPPRLRSRRVYYEMPAEEAEALIAAHRALLPAKERMLRLALERGARWQDATYESRMPALHLAAYYGTPAMVELLLRHGADPDAVNRDDGRGALTFVIERDEFFQRMTYLPRELQTPAERNAILRRLAEAARTEPYREFDRSDSGLPPGYLRFAMWQELIRDPQIETQTLRTLAGRGWAAAPLFSDTLYNPLQAAAEAGRADALQLLRDLTPRRWSDPATGHTYDLWLDAATQALYTLPEAVPSLIDETSPWTQRSRHGYPENAPRRRPLLSSSGADTDFTLAGHAARSGRGDLLELLGRRHPAALAAADGLVDAALQGGHAALAARLLAQGFAPPSRDAAEHGGSRLREAIGDAVQYNEVALLRALLAALTPEEIAALGAEAPPLRRLSDPTSGPDRPRRDRRAAAAALLGAGFSAAGMAPGQIASLIEDDQADTAALLLENGAPVEAEGDLIAAVRGGHGRLLAMLLQKDEVRSVLGGQPGQTALAWAYTRGDAGSVRLLEDAGAALADEDRLLAASMSGQIELLRDAARRHAGPVTACLPDGALRLALEQPGWLEALRDAGFGSTMVCGGVTVPLHSLMAVAATTDPGRLPLFGTQRRALAKERLALAVRLAGSGDDAYALRHAVRTGRDDVLEILLESGFRDTAAPGSARPDGLLWTAVEHRRPDSARLLARHGYRLSADELAGWFCLPAARRALFEGVIDATDAPCRPAETDARTVTGRWSTRPAKGEERHTLLIHADRRFELLAAAASEPPLLVGAGRWEVQDGRLRLLTGDAAPDLKLTVYEGEAGVLRLKLDARYDLMDPPRIALDDGTLKLWSPEGGGREVRLDGPLRALAIERGGWSILPLPHEAQGLRGGTLVVTGDFAIAPALEETAVEIELDGREPGRLSLGGMTFYRDKESGGGAEARGRPAR